MLQVKNSPDIDTHKPVSRQQEAAYLGYYGYPPYWDGPALWGAVMYATPITPTEAAEIDAHLEAERDRAITQGGRPSAQYTRGHGLPSESHRWRAGACRRFSRRGRHLGDSVRRHRYQ
jgi:hypothetical protein